MKYATPFIDLFRPLTPAESKALTESIKVQGVIAPVVVYQSAKHGPAIIDGVNRWGIASELKIDCPVDDRGEMDDDVAEELADELNAARRHLTAEDIKAHAAKRRKVVAELRAEGDSIRTIAEKTGAAKSIIENDLAQISEGKTTVLAKTVDVKKTKGKDGKTRTAKPKREPKPAKPPKSADDPTRGGNNFDYGANAKTPEPIEVVEAEDPGKAFVAELEETCREIDRLKARIESWKSNPLVYTTHWQSHVANLESVRKSIWQGRPCHVCPYCDGEKCDTCKKTGRVQKSTYKSGCEAMGKDAAA